MLYWRFEHTGLYSVKSAYKWLQMQRGGWHTDDRGSIWNKLWRAKAPPKACNLVWRALTGCLPTLTQLHSKHVPIQLICRVCQSAIEDVTYSLLLCSIVAQYWGILNANIQWGHNMEFTDWIWEILNSGNPKQRAEAITLCCAIWRARNDVIWKQKTSSVNRIVAAEKQYLTQWTFSQDRSINTYLQPQNARDGAIFWERPQQKSVKVSVDATIF